MITKFQNSHNMYCSEREMRVQQVPNGIILPRVQVQEGPMWGLGGVCDGENAFVELSAYDGGWASHGGYYPWEQEHFVDCDVVYFGVYFSHWGHFLIDLMGRLWYFVKHRGEKVKLAYLGEEDPQGNFLEIFQLLGIEREDLIRVTEPTRFRSVIVPEFSCKSCCWYSAEYRSIFDSMICRVEQEQYAPAGFSCPEKVYFSRLSFGKAKSTEFGEDLIARWVQENGFTLISPEKLTVRDQIYIWNHAQEIVCLDGSIPMGVAFSQNPDLKLTILHKTSLEHLNVELYLLMRPCDVTLLDVWYEPFRGYPKNIGAGPFLLHLGEDARAYSRLRGWSFPFADEQLRRERNINCVNLALRILDLSGRARVIASRILPRRVKSVIRKVLSHGK